MPLRALGVHHAEGPAGGRQAIEALVAARAVGAVVEDPPGIGEVGLQVGVPAAAEERAADGFGGDAHAPQKGAGEVGHAPAVALAGRQDRVGLRRRAALELDVVVDPRAGELHGLGGVAGLAGDRLAGRDDLGVLAVDGLARGQRRGETLPHGLRIGQLGGRRKRVQAGDLNGEPLLHRDPLHLRRVPRQLEVAPAHAEVVGRDLDLVRLDAVGELRLQDDLLVRRAPEAHHRRDPGRVPAALDDRNLIPPNHDHLPRVPGPGEEIGCRRRGCGGGRHAGDKGNA